MLLLAEVQTTDALYTNESIHFNNRSPIWHPGPSSTLHPGRGSHSCFQTAVHIRASWPSDQLFWSDLATATKGEDFMFQIIFQKRGLRFRTAWGVESSGQVTFALARDLRFGQYLQLRGGIYLSPSFKPYTKVWEDSYWGDFWNTTGTFGPVLKTLWKLSVFLWRSGGAQRLAVDLLLFAKVL